MAGKTQKRGVFLYVAGDIFDFWQSYAVRSDLLDPAGSFTMRAPLKPERNSRDVLVYDSLHAGARVDLRVTTADGKVTPQLTGRIDRVVVEEDVDAGAHIEVHGRSHTWRLIDADVIPSFAFSGITYRDLVYKVTGLFGYSTTQIVVSDDANRVLTTGKAAAGTTLSKDAPIDLQELKLPQAQPHPGETAWQLLDRHAKRLGLLLWGTADGKIVIARPNYEQRPQCRLAMLRGPAGQGNNVKSFTRAFSVLGIPSEVHVYGKGPGHDFFKSAVHAVVTNPDIADLVPLTVYDHTVKDRTEADRRAKRELSIRKQGADVVSARVAGHLGSSGGVYAIDTIADVQWDAGSQHGPMYVIRRTFDCTRNDAEHTTLELVPKGSIAVQ